MELATKILCYSIKRIPVKSIHGQSGNIKIKDLERDGRIVLS
jgi:hypothetical protein